MSNHVKSVLIQWIWAFANFFHLNHRLTAMTETSTGCTIWSTTSPGRLGGSLSNPMGSSPPKRRTALVAPHSLRRSDAPGSQGMWPCTPGEPSRRSHGAVGNSPPGFGQRFWQRCPTDFPSLTFFHHLKHLRWFNLIDRYWSIYHDLSTGILRIFHLFWSFLFALSHLVTWWIVSFHLWGCHKSGWMHQ